ncbi:hypothetical protein ACFPRL_10090 [Pseudoclavibacter helvolus]
MRRVLGEYATVRDTTPNDQFASPTESAGSPTSTLSRNSSASPACPPFGCAGETKTTSRASRTVDRSPSHRTRTRSTWTSCRAWRLSSASRSEYSNREGM